MPGGDARECAVGYIWGFIEAYDVVDGRGAED
jgi:hypothetical protein